MVKSGEIGMRLLGRSVATSSVGMEVGSPHKVESKRDVGSVLGGWGKLPSPLPWID